GSRSPLFLSPAGASATSTRTIPHVSKEWAVMCATPTLGKRACHRSSTLGQPDVTPGEEAGLLASWLTGGSGQGLRMNGTPVPRPGPFPQGTGPPWRATWVTAHRLSFRPRGTFRPQRRMYLKEAGERLPADTPCVSWRQEVGCLQPTSPPSPSKTATRR